MNKQLTLSGMTDELAQARTSKKEFLAFGETPQTPRFIAFCFREAVTPLKEKRQHIMYCLSQTRYGAHVAPQRCTIPRIGKAVSLYHIG